MRCCIGQSRRCVGHPGDTSVAPTLRGVHSRRCVGHPGGKRGAPTLRGVRPRRCGRTPGRARGAMRDDARRGATCDARCRNGTRCPRRFVRGECGVASANCGVASVIRATQVSPLRCGGVIHGIAAGHPGGRMGRCATMSVGAPHVTPGAGTAQGVGGVSCGANAVLHRPIAALCRSSGRHECRPYAAGCSSTALRRATRAARVASRRCGVCGGRVVSRLVETASRTVFSVAVTVFLVSRPAPLVTALVNVRGLMDFGGGEETFCSTKLD